MFLGWVDSAIPLEDEVRDVASHFRATGRICATSQVFRDAIPHLLLLSINHHTLLSPQETNRLKEKGHEDDLFGSQILRGQQN